MADYVVRLNGEDNLTQTIDKAKQSLNDFGKTGASQIEKIDAKFNKITSSSAPLKRQLRDLQQLLANMNMNGLSNTDQYTKIAEAAGQIKDAIDDASEATRRFSNDTATLQAGIQAFQGLAAAGSVVTGAMAMLGTENENVARSIQKVQGALAILNGVQAIANTLNKDSALMLKLKQVSLAASTAWTTANTAATTANTVATSANNVAMRIWNVTKAISKALLGDFTGLLIVGAGALATYAIATSKSTEEQGKLNNATDRGKTLQEMIIEARKQGLSAIAEEKNRIEALQRVVDSANTSYKDKVSAINQLKSIIPSYTATISAEGVVHSNAVTAIRNHIAALDDLQKAIAAYKVGQQIQDKVSQADFEKFLADQKVGRKQNNIRADEREMERHQNDGGYTWNGGRSQAYIDARDRRDINRRNLETAKQEQRTADIRLKNAKQEQQLQKKWQQTQGSTQAQTAVALANGDPTKAVDIFLGRNQPTNGGGGGGGRSTGGGHTTVTNRDIEEQTQYQTKLNNLQSQYNSNLISELEYRRRIVDVEKSHLKHLFGINKATAQDVSRLKNAENQLRTTEAVNTYMTNMDDVYRQYDNGLMNAVEKQEAEVEELRKVYLEFIRAADEVKESQRDFYANEISKSKERLDKGIIDEDMYNLQVKIYNEALDEQLRNLTEQLAGYRKQYEDAVKELDRLSQIEPAEKAADKLLNQEYKPKEKSSYEKATDDGVETWDEQLSAIEEQMNYNDNLIAQLNEIKQLYEELGLVGTDGYESVNAKILELSQSNDELAVQVGEVQQKQSDWQRQQDNIEGVAESVDQLGGIFGSLGMAIGGTEGEWLNFTSQVLEGTARLIPLISKLVLAKQAEAIASGTAEGAKLPPPANIAAILSIVGIITSIFASLPKFASGGIIGGASRYGDNVLARVNSGEMILSTRQQQNLFDLIDNGIINGGAEQTVNFKIKGQDLYGTLKNYGKTTIRTGKNISI